MRKTYDKHKKIIATTLIGATLLTQTGVIVKQHQDLMTVVDKNNKLDSTNKELSKEVSEAKSAIKEQNTILQELETKVNNQAEELIKAEKEKNELNKTIKEIKWAKQKQKEQENQNNTSISRGSVGRGTPVTIKLSFYGGGAEENGGYAGMNAYNGKLYPGTVASNVYPRGTKFQLPNGQIFTVEDRGGPAFNSYGRLDVYVPQLPGESKDAYDRRISNYGHKTVTMYKL